MNIPVKYIFILSGLLLSSTANAQDNKYKDSVVQLYGVVMSADSLKGLPAVSVVIKGQNRGTITNEGGVFSIVAIKGDEIEFSSIGFKPKSVKIDPNLNGNQYSMIQLMINDTVFLPATIIKKRISREQFERDFINTTVPDDDISIARQNTNLMTRQYLMATLPIDGKEASTQYLRQSARKMYYFNQNAPQNIFNPVAWAEFIKAWKRGDYRKKKQS